MFSICHMTSREYMFKWLCLWMEVPHYDSSPCYVSGHWSSTNGDINCLIWQVILQNHVIKGSRNSLSGSSSWYVIILAN